MALANSAPAFIVGLILYGMTGFVLAPMNSYITNVRGNLSIGRAIAIPSGIYSLGTVIASNFPFPKMRPDMLPIPMVAASW